MVLRSRPAIRIAPCWGAGGVVIGILAVLGSAGIVSADDAPVYYCNGKAIALEEVDDQVTVVMSADADRSTVAAELAERGMPTMIPPSRGSIRSGYRLVPVRAADADTMAQIRAVGGIGQVRRLYREPVSGRNRIVTDRVVVRFMPGLGRAEVDACLAAHGVRRIRQIEGLTDVYLVQVIDAAGDAVRRAAALYQDNRTVYCHPDFLADIHPAQVQIADEFYGQQWHLNNTGQLGAKSDADVDWAEAWAEVAGLQGLQEVIIAVHDDGVQTDHEDLAAAYLLGSDIWEGDADPSPGFSDDNHGTAVAGVAVARLNGIGVVGAAPTARLVAIRQAYGLSTDADWAEGFLFALSKGVDIINNSWGGAVEPPDVLREAIEAASSQGRNGRGMLITFSAGNEFGTVAFWNPIAGLPGVIAVGASNCFDRHSMYSNTGPELCVVAPSSGFATGTLGITTTDVEDDAGLPTKGYNDGTGTDIYGYPDLANGDYSQNFGGTSSACPLTSGVIGLILGVGQGFHSEQVRRILEHTADQIDTTTGDYDSITGHSEMYGYGRVNAYQAVLAARESAAAPVGGSYLLTWPPPVSDLQITGTSTVNLSWKNPTEEPNEVASVMVVHSSIGAITWTPNGMRTEAPEDYNVDDIVAPGVQVVRNGLSQTYVADPGPGEHYYAVFVRNANNRWSWGRWVSSTLGTKSAPKASVSALPRIGSAPLTVDFTGGAIDIDRENVDFTYSWDFGDGASASGPQGISHKYSTPGTYMAKLTVKDDFELTGTAMVRIQVLPEATDPPTASITLLPGDGEAPHTVILSGPLSSNIKQWAWDFGDGYVAQGQTVEHTYRYAGAYAITLEVTDDKGATAKAAVAVSVWAPAPTSTGTGNQTPTEDGLLNGACGFAGGTLLLAMMLGWTLLHTRRRRI